MKTQLCQLLAYCETTGGPICICSPEAASKWQGSEQEDSLYWEVAEQIGMATLFNYNQDYSFFNSETGNFAFFRGENTLILIEIISIEEDASIPWKGIEFNIKPSTRSTRKLSGLTCFFDSTLSIQQHIVTQEGVHAIDQSSTWNLAVLDCDYYETHEVHFTSATMHLEGICFIRERS